MEKKNSRWSTIGFWLIIAFFYLPILYVIFFSFNRSKSLTNFTGFSLRWYERMFSSRPILEAVGVTFACAVIATAVSTVAGTITAIGLSKSKKVLREAIQQVNNLPELFLRIGFTGRFDMQVDNAHEWCDIVNSYFYRKCGIDDEKGRTIY